MMREGQFRSYKVDCLVKGIKGKISYYFKEIYHYQPRIIQIQTIDACSNSCIMCPNEHLTRSKKVMDWDVFNRLVKQMKAFNNLDIVLTLFNEPLLDPMLIDRVKLIKSELESSNVYLITNGLFLNKNMMNALNSAGINAIHISIDAFSERTYKQIRGTKSYRALVQKVFVLRDINSSLPIVRFLRQKLNHSEEKDFVTFWRRYNIKTFVYDVGNRANNLTNFNRIKIPHKPTISRITNSLYGKVVRGCTTPFTMMNILFNGDVVLCDQDWSSKSKIGNILIDTLDDIWNSDVYNNFRETHKDINLKHHPLCRQCSIINQGWF